MIHTSKKVVDDYAGNGGAGVQANLMQPSTVVNSNVNIAIDNKKEVNNKVLSLHSTDNNQHSSGINKRKRRLNFKRK
jgi:hypothetical protein